MKISKQQLKKIKEYSLKCVSKNDFWHREIHIKQTVKLAKALAKKEKADINKCIIAAWLHDISKYKQIKNKKINHADESAKQARVFLKKLKLKKEDIEDVCYAIKEHNKGGKKRIREAEVIWDADKLQAVGPYGLVRCVGVCTTWGYDHNVTYNKNKIYQKFFLKRFFTKTGKKVAKEECKFLEQFYKRYKKILDAKL